eukprot:759579-Hanusia_phi.AAC.4
MTASAAKAQVRPRELQGLPTHYTGQTSAPEPSRSRDVQQHEDNKVAKLSPPEFPTSDKTTSDGTHGGEKEEDDEYSSLTSTTRRLYPKKDDVDVGRGKAPAMRRKREREEEEEEERRELLIFFAAGAQRWGKKGQAAQGRLRVSDPSRLTAVQGYNIEIDDEEQVACCLHFCMTTATGQQRLRRRRGGYRSSGEVRSPSPTSSLCSHASAAMATPPQPGG